MMLIEQNTEDCLLRLAREFQAKSRAEIAETEQEIEGLLAEQNALMDAIHQINIGWPKDSFAFRVVILRAWIEGLVNFSTTLPLALPYYLTEHPINDFEREAVQIAFDQKFDRAARIHPAGNA